MPMHDTASWTDTAGMQSNLGVHLPRFSSEAPPPSRWSREAHQDRPVVAFIEPMLAAFERGFRTGFARWGFPLGGMSHAVIDGWLFLAEEDLTDVDELQRRLERVETVGDLTELRACARWFSTVLMPEVDARRRAVAPGPLTSCSADELAEALVAAYSLLVEFAEQRMANVVGTNLLTSAFLVDGASAGLSRLDCLRHLAGSSRSTTALARDAAGHDIGDRQALAEAYSDDLLGTDGTRPPLTPLEGAWWVKAVAPDLPEPATTGAPLPDELVAALADARLAQDVREASRELFMRLLGRARRIAAELGSRLVERGVLEDADDVAFLTPAELASLSGAGASAPSVTALVRSRRHELAAAAATPPAPGLGTPLPSTAPLAEMVAAIGPGAMRVFVLAMSWTPSINGGEPAAAVDAADDGVMRGVPASPGVVTAPVRVVHDVDGLLEVEPGEILVCGCTTPAWSVAVSISAGLIATGGGDCSHPAIVAREFGIPAVVGAAAATSLRTGDVVTLDGAAGTVALHAA